MNIFPFLTMCMALGFSGGWLIVYFQIFQPTISIHIHAKRSRRRWILIGALLVLLSAGAFFALIGGVPWI